MNIQRYAFQSVSAIVLAAVLPMLTPQVVTGRDIDFNIVGNILIADQYNNRVIEVNDEGRIVWQFGGGPNDASPNSILGVKDARRLGTLTLMTGTEIPPGTNPAFPDGVVDNRVILVDAQGNIVWQYGQFGIAGSDDNELNEPVQSLPMPDHDILITDRGNHRVIKVGLNQVIHWQYGTTGRPGSEPNELRFPNSAELLTNGNILIADGNNNRAIEVDAQHRIVSSFVADGALSNVSFASRLPNGHTLLTDSNNSRIVEVDVYDEIVWQYFTNQASGSVPSPFPTRAIRLKTGQTLISDQFNDRVIVVNPSGTIAEHFGYLNTPGYGLQNTGQGLNGPADAKVIGDSTGLTAPFPELQY